MSIPPRGRTSQSCYFITSKAHIGKQIFQTDRMARLMIDVFYDYRAQQKYLLHEFVVMPNHLHLLLTPQGETTLERSMQLIKGGFSFRAKKELRYMQEIWQASFHDRRIRDMDEYISRKIYIHQNPVAAGLVSSPELYEYSSASGKYELDPYLGG